MLFDLANKYRPKKFSELIGQTPLAYGMSKASLKGNLKGLVILEGQYGGGKTSTARIAVAASNCLDLQPNGDPCGCCEVCKAIQSGTCMDYTEFDAASNSGVEDVDRILDKLAYEPSMLKRQCITIDEAHGLSQKAFEHFLKITEENKEVLIIFCTTSGNKIPATIRSRASLVYNIVPIEADVMAKRLAEGAQAENINIEPEAIDYIAEHSDGSMRNAWKLLEQMGNTFDKVTLTNVRESLNLETEDDMVILSSFLIDGNVECVLEILDSIAKEGKSFISILIQLEEVFTKILMAKVKGESKNEVIFSFIKSHSLNQISEGAHLLSETIKMVKAGQSKSSLIIKMVSNSVAMGKSDLEGRLASAEKKIEMLEAKLSGTAFINMPIMVENDVEPEKVASSDENFTFVVKESEVVNDETFSNEEVAKECITGKVIPVVANENAEPICNIDKDTECNFEDHRDIAISFGHNCPSTCCQMCNLDCEVRCTPSVKARGVKAEVPKVTADKAEAPKTDEPVVEEPKTEKPADKKEEVKKEVKKFVTAFDDLF